MLMKPSLCHWNAGAHCAMSLYLAQKSSQVICLLNLNIHSEESRPMGGVLPIQMLRKIADSFKIPLISLNTSNTELSTDIKRLTQFLSDKYHINTVYLNMFEDSSLYLDLKTTYKVLNLHAETVLLQSRLTPLLSEYCEMGFVSKIISVNEKKLTRDYLGLELTKDLIFEFQKRQIHPFGLGGEFTTVCTHSPLHSEPVMLKFGEVSFKNGYWVHEPLV